MEHEKTLRCLMEIHALSKIPRTGWILAGVPNPETVTEHSFETALFAYLLSQKVNANVDLGKILLMALFHEIAEARITDLPRRSKDYVGEAKRRGERTATIDILGGIAPSILGFLDELHEKQSTEARIVEAAEELQILFKAMVYAKESRGDMSEYRRDAARYDSLGIDAAKHLASAIQEKLNTYLNGKPFWEIGYSKDEGH